MSNNSISYNHHVVHYIPCTNLQLEAYTFWTPSSKFHSPSPTSGSHKTFSMSLDFLILDPTYKWDHIIFVFLSDLFQLTYLQGSS